ncbi:MAG: hypothetical protein ACT4P6_20655 [Gemmatimonadaceae bacterium]
MRQSRLFALAVVGMAAVFVSCDDGTTVCALQPEFAVVAEVFDATTVRDAIARRPHLRGCMSHLEHARDVVPRRQ